MIRIILVCAAGMSTSILVNNMRKMADPKDEIHAYPLAQLEDHIQDCDVVLVGPQIRYQMEMISKLAEVFHVEAALMDQKSYAMMDAAKLLDTARSLVKK